MKKVVFLLSLLLIISVGLNAKAPVKKMELKVLYVYGTPEYEPMSMQEEVPADILSASVKKRMKSFEKFLNDYFTSVTVIDAKNYTQDMSYNYDVTVMDGVPKPIVPMFQDRAKGVYMRPGYLTENFDRPILAIGYVSHDIGRRIGTKHDWYCLCLESDAHSWKTDHPIFNCPFDVKMTVVNKPTPEPIYNFPLYFADGQVPNELPMWKVQTYDYNSDEQYRIGLVSRPGGY